MKKTIITVIITVAIIGAIIGSFMFGYRKGVYNTATIKETIEDVSVGAYRMMSTNGGDQETEKIIRLALNDVFGYFSRR